MADSATTRPDGNGPVSGRSPESEPLAAVLVSDFPRGALILLAAELRSYGSAVIFTNDGRGFVQSPDGGHLRFCCLENEGDTALQVFVMEKPAYFPLALVVGGIRQTCQEAAERWRKQNAG
jgi:hypothetical protein